MDNSCPEEMLQEKNNLLKKYKRKPTIIIRIKYKLYRNTLKSSFRLAEKNYYLSKFKNKINDARATWKLINAILNNKSDRICNSYFIINGVSETNKNIIVNEFNTFFVNIGPDLAAAIPSSSKQIEDFLKKGLSESMLLLPTDEAEVINIINCL